MKAPRPVAGQVRPQAAPGATVAAVPRAYRAGAGAASRAPRRGAPQRGNARGAGGGRQPAAAGAVAPGAALRAGIGDPK
jgi:hypothetical protein